MSRSPQITGNIVSVYDRADTVKLLAYLVSQKARFDVDPFGDHYNVQILGVSAQQLVRQAFKYLGWETTSRA